MRIVIALGGNAMPVPVVAPRISALSQQHQLILTCALGARAESVERGLAGHLPPGMPLVTLLTTVEVDLSDPAFADPTAFVGPAYGKADADRLADELGWKVRPDGRFWRRVLPSPQPKRLSEIRPLRWLLQRQAVVVCANGKPAVGKPSDDQPDADREPGPTQDVEAVVDQDLAAEVLAREVDADVFILATDIDGVYAEWGTARQRRLDRVTPNELRSHDFPATSMGPKVAAAARFAELTRRRAVIGALSEVDDLVGGRAGTQVLCCGHRK